MLFEHDLIGLIAGILTTGAFLPQIVKVLSTKSANDFSYGWLLMTVLGLFLWLLYGMLIKSLPIVLFNFFSITFLLVIIYFKKFGLKITLTSA